MGRGHSDVGALRLRPFARLENGTGIKETNEQNRLKWSVVKFPLRAECIFDHLPPREPLGSRARPHGPDVGVLVEGREDREEAVRDPGVSGLARPGAQELNHVVLRLQREHLWGVGGGESQRGGIKRSSSLNFWLSHF